MNQLICVVRDYNTAYGDYLLMKYEDGTEITFNCTGILHIELRRPFEYINTTKINNYMRLIYNNLEFDDTKAEEITNFIVNKTNKMMRKLIMKLEDNHINTNSLDDPEWDLISYVNMDEIYLYYKRGGNKIIETGYESNELKCDNLNLRLFVFHILSLELIRDTFPHTEFLRGGLPDTSFTCLDFRMETEDDLFERFNRNLKENGIKIYSISELPGEWKVNPFYVNVQ